MARQGRPDFDWVVIPGGLVRIGVDPAPSARAGMASPGSSVDLRAFAITRTPVTNAEYAAFVAATGHRAPAHWEGARPPAWLADHPVTYVDWADARAFCAWARVRLPSEAEWERTARGTDGRPWPWGWAPPDQRRANVAGRIGATTVVAAYPDGASPVGALDMAGGVWEWTASLERPYPYHPTDGREADGPGRRILRGGSFNHAGEDTRCAARDALYPDACDEYIGFRVATDEPARGRPPGFDWVEVPDGPFWMGEPDAVGSDRSDLVAFLPGLGTPAHHVEVATFAIARTPVTNAQFEAFVEATGSRPPGHWASQTAPVGSRDQPVTHVDWHEARAFCAWATARLPTEVEWERAAAGPAGRAYPWGDAEPDPTTAWFGHAADQADTAPVLAHPAGATPDGIRDLAGNVWEWTASLHRGYPYRPDDGREDPDALGQRVLRGGSFRSPTAVYLRCAFRSRSHPTRRRDHIGFRVVRVTPADLAP